MQVVTVFLVCCTLLVAGQGQQPRPCAVPALLEGRIVSIDPSKHYEFVAKFSYDGLEERERVVGELITGPNQTQFLDTILLYREKTAYAIFHHNKTCTKAPLTEPFRRVEVPHDATFNGQLVIGGSSAPGEGLLVNSWGGDIKEHGVRYLMTVTEFGCLPISVLYNVNQTGWVVNSYYDMTTGIQDPNVFIPPEFCK